MLWMLCLLHLTLVEIWNSNDYGVKILVTVLGFFKKMPDYTVKTADTVSMYAGVDRDWLN